MADRHGPRAGGPGNGARPLRRLQRTCAPSHDDLDRDEALQIEVKNVALALVETVRQIPTGRYRRPDAGLADPRPK